MKSALMVNGGWSGHQPHEFARVVGGRLEQEGYDVEHVDSLEALEDASWLEAFDVIIPNWTMGEIADVQQEALQTAIESGVGLAGWHGGMGDAFRANLRYKMMVGGQFVAHPGGIMKYRVDIAKPDDPVVDGLSAFEIESERYFMHVDPSIDVLATTTFTGEPLPWLEGIVMPVAWKRHWGRARVFYSSLGHQVDELQIPEVMEITIRGIRWATR